MIYIDELKRFLKELEKESIKYCILRNFNFLLNEKKTYDGKDIDILVIEKDLKKIKKVCQKQKFKQIKICPCSNHRAYVKKIKDKREILSIHLHINGASGSKGVYYPSKIIFKNIKKIKGFWIPLENDEFVLLFLQNFLVKNKSKQKYIQRLNELMKKVNLKLIKNRLNYTFEKKLSNKLIFILKTESFEKIDSMRKELIKSFSKKHFFNITKTNICKFFWAFKRIIFEKSPLIALIGMDGSGKTTTTNNLKKELSKSLINTKFIYTGRGRNNIIPISFFARFIKPPKDKKFNLNQDQQEEKVNLIRTMTSFVFAIDLLLRYLFIILPARKRYNLVITDRYSTDLLLMKGVPKRLKRFIYFFIPKPTKLIYLYQDIEILNKRKPEHPKQDLVRQEKLFSKILNKKIMKTKIVKIKNINLNKTINLCLENIFNELK